MQNIGSVSYTHLSGIIDVIAELFRCGMISPKGKFIREGKRIKHDAYGMGSYVLAFEEEAEGTKDVEITEVDIDNFIRAKGAIFSAVRTMLKNVCILAARVSCEMRFARRAILTRSPQTFRRP